MKKLLLITALFFASLPALATNFNAWTDHGVISTGLGTDPEQPTVMYLASGCQIVSSPCFAMWYTTGASGTSQSINYAESQTPTTNSSWSAYSSNPVLSAYGFGRVYKNGSTYYLFASPYNSGSLPKQIDVYTSSNGLSWSLATSGALTKDGNHWDATALCQLNVLAIVSGTWYGYYTGLSNTSEWSMGLATSTNGTTWTPGGSNPVITAYGPSNFSTWQYIGGNYYGWSQIVMPFYPYNSGLPSDIMRFSTPSPTGPFTALGTTTFYRTQTLEGVGMTLGQVADPCLIAVGGTTYMFFTSTDNDGAPYQISVATTSAPFNQLVFSAEGVNNIPIPFTSYNLAMQASDAFARANGGLGANWTQMSSNSGFTSGQIVSNQVTCGTAGDNCDSYYNAITWPNDQWVTVTVDTCLASSFVGIALRATANNDYRIYWHGTAGSSGTVVFQRYHGSFSALTTSPSSIAFTLNTNDTLTGAVIGTNIYLYHNGALVGTASDSNISSGSGGFAMSPTTATSNAYIGLFSGGGFQSAPVNQVGGKNAINF